MNEIENAITDAALNTAPNGWFNPRYVQLDDAAKGPRTKEWQLKSFSSDAKDKALAAKPDFRVGMLFGPASDDPTKPNGSGVIDVECDSPGAQIEYDRLFVEPTTLTPILTPTWKSKRGLHHLYRWDDRFFALASVVHLNEIEYRFGSHGGTQSVCPPTEFDDCRRRWLDGLSPRECEIKKVPEEVIRELLANESAQHFKSGDFEPKPFEGFDELAKLGHELKNQRAVKLQDYFRANGFQTGTEVLPTGRIKLSIDRCVFKPANQKVKDGAPCVFINNDGTIEYKCFHPKDQGKFWQDVEAAVGAELDPQATGDDIAEPDLSELIVQDNDLQDKSNDAWFDDFAIATVVSSDGVKEEKQKLDIYECINARELVSRKYEMVYLIENALAQDQPCVIAGPEKCFKTCLSVDMAISLASGTPFLGHFNVPQAVPVLIISGESWIGVLHDKVLQICKARGIEVPANLHFKVDAGMPQFMSKVQMQTLANTIQHYGAKVTIIDPLYHCTEGIEHNDAGDMGVALKRVNDTCLLAGSTFVLNAHFRKQDTGKEFKRPTLTEISQAGSREYFRQWLLLWKRSYFDAGRIGLCAEINGAKHNGDWAIDIDEGYGDDLKWDVTVSPLNKVQKQETVEAVKDKLLGTIDCYPDGVSKTALFKAAGIIKEYHKETGLEALLIEGSLVSFDKVAGNNRTNTYYKRAPQLSLS